MVETERKEEERTDRAETFNRASKYWQDVFNVWAKAVGSFPQGSGATDAERWFRPFQFRAGQEAAQAERAAKQSTDYFEFYRRASSYWLDAFNSWARWAGSFPQGFGGMNMEAFPKMPWMNMAEWTRSYSGFTDMARMMPFTAIPMRDTSEAVARGMNSYMKVFNAWLKGMDAMGREGFEIGQKIGSGEQVQVDSFFESMKTAYTGITTGVLEVLKDTPFAGMKGIDRAVKDALDSLPEEQEMARAFFQELLDFSVRQRNLSTDAMKQVSKTSEEMLRKGIVLDGGYKDLIEAYGEMLRHSTEVVRVPTALAPEYKDIADNAASWAKANMDLCMSWFEMNLKLYQGIALSAREMCKTSAELFEPGKASSSEFGERWATACRQAADTMVKDSQFPEQINKLMNGYTGWMGATSRLCRSMMTSPCATKEDIQRVSHEVEKVKSSVEKRASSRTRAEER